MEHAVDRQPMHGEQSGVDIHVLSSQGLLLGRLGTRARPQGLPLGRGGLRGPSDALSQHSPSWGCRAADPKSCGLRGGAVARGCGLVRAAVAAVPGHRRAAGAPALTQPTLSQVGLFEEVQKLYLGI